MANERLNILKFLIENQEKAYSMRQIALERKINYKTAYLNLKALADEGAVELVEHGNTTLCSFNRRWNGTVYAVEHQRRDDLLKNKDFLALSNRLASLNSQFILLLFGSHAKRQSTVHSDIDLLLITDEPKPIETQLNLLPLKLHVTTVRYDEFIAMLRSREFTVGSEAVKNNIILFGIEDYYRLVNNAR